MTFLPIVERELRVASRRRSTYFGRLAGAVVAMGIGGWLLMVTQYQPSNEVGQILFVALSVMLFLYSLVAGARITADCLSEEKREGTLGLLFLTDLKGYDIVSGKLAANSVNTFYGLLSAFPVLAISLLMGGVTSAEFWRVTLVATNLLFFSLATGIFASSLCRDERRAMSLAFLLLLLFLGASPLVELCLRIANPHRAATTFWLVPSPAFACFTAFGSRIGLKPTQFWTPVLFTHLYGWIFLILASVIVPRSWQDKAARAPLPFRGFWRTIFRTNRAAGIARRTRLLEINPFLWLAARDPLKTFFVWSALLLICGFWLWLVVRWPKEWLSIPSYIFLAVMLHTILKFWLASEACYRFVEDRKSSALELLLSTPLSVEEILQGQRLALFRQFAGPTCFVLTADLVLMFLGLNDGDLSGSDERTFWVMLWCFGAIVLVMDLFALSWVSMWTGLTSKKANQAANAAISRILVLPWLAFFMLLTLFATVSAFSRLHFDEDFFLPAWLVIAVINNLVFMNWAKTNLHNRLREVATQRFANGKPFARWLKAVVPGQKTDLPPVIQ